MSRPNFSRTISRALAEGIHLRPEGAITFSSLESRMTLRMRSSEPLMGVPRFEESSLPSLSEHHADIVQNFITVECGRQAHGGNRQINLASDDGDDDPFVILSAVGCTGEFVTREFTKTNVQTMGVKYLLYLVAMREQCGELSSGLRVHSLRSFLTRHTTTVRVWNGLLPCNSLDALQGSTSGGEQL